jgi:hypothetical protein
MRMVQHPAGPGMEHSDKARLSTEVTRVMAEFLERLGAFLKEERV